MKTITLEEKWNNTLKTLNESQRRYYLANEAKALGYGGVARISRATGISRETIHVGIREIDNGMELLWKRARKPGGGKKRIHEAKPPVPADTHGNPNFLQLTQNQQTGLTYITRQKTSSQRLVFRSHIILDYSRTGKKRTVAAMHNTSREAVSRWVKRWKDALEGLNLLEMQHSGGSITNVQYRKKLALLLADIPRPGPPPVFTEEDKRKILALSKEEPEKVGMPVTNWTHKLLAQAAVKRGIVKKISPAQLGRFLKQGSPQTAFV
jgi:transposase